MKWRQWGILIALVLLNYIIFSTAFTQLAKQRNAATLALRTPMPTFESIDGNPVAWIVLPTSTQLPSRTPVTATATATATEIVATAEVTPTVAITATETPLPTTTPIAVEHEVQGGETLGEIAQAYSTTVESLVTANSLSDPDQIDVGQLLIIPVSEAVPPTPEVEPTAAPPTATPTSKPPTPTSTPKPPTPTPTPTPVPIQDQFTATLIWDPLVAPNCGGPGISNISTVQDVAGNPVNGVRVQVNCYANIWLSRPTGNPGEYDPGHYDFSFGQTEPQAWICTARVFDINSQPVDSSEVATIVFDTNDCTPGGSGHQIAILNWTKHW